MLSLDGGRIASVLFVGIVFNQVRTLEQSFKGRQKIIARYLADEGPDRELPILGLVIFRTETDDGAPFESQKDIAGIHRP